MNILLVITMGTQNGLKIIVKVVIAIYYVLVVTVWTQRGPIN